MKTKIWTLIAVCFILIGGIIFVGAMSMLNWDFKGLNTTKYETKEHIIEEGFKNISINTNTADIEFVKTTGKGCLVECKQLVKESHSVSVVGDTLVIERNDTRKWYDHISFFSFDAPKIRVELPDNIYSSLTINLSTGDINAEGITAGSINFTTSTGDINLKAVECSGKIEANVTTGKCEFTNVRCESLTSNGDTGDIKFQSVYTGKKLYITRSTGDVELYSCDADELFIETDTGDVNGSLLTSKVFICKTDTGKVEVPTTTEGGKCEIITDTGDIKLEVEE